MWLAVQFAWLIQCLLRYTNNRSGVQDSVLQRRLQAPMAENSISMPMNFYMRHSEVSGCVGYGRIGLQAIFQAKHRAEKDTAIIPNRTGAFPGNVGGRGACEL